MQTQSANGTAAAAENSSMSRTGRLAGRFLAQLTGSRIGMITVTSAAVLYLTGCSGGSSTSTAPVSPGVTSSHITSASASTSAAPTGALTGSELLWLQAMEKERAKINSAIENEPTTPTTAQMLAMASVLRGCATRVTHLGRPGNPRLLPVFESMMKSCAQFAKAAKCQTTLAVSNDPAKLNEAASCVSATTLAGGKEMATAEEAILNLEHPTG
jgi:hypothetical protein